MEILSDDLIKICGGDTRKKPGVGEFHRILGLSVQKYPTKSAYRWVGLTLYCDPHFLSLILEPRQPYAQSNPFVTHGTVRMPAHGSIRGVVLPNGGLRIP